MPTSSKNSRPRRNSTSALEAVGNLTNHGLNNILFRGQMDALSAHQEIKITPIQQKTGPFYRNLLPLRKDLVSVLADSYRRYFKLALANPRQARHDPDRWSLAHLQPAVSATLEWLRDWYILACDGENQWTRNVGSTEFVPGQSVSLSIPIIAPPPLPSPKSWRAPAWLFGVSLVVVGIGPLKPENIPATDSEQRLGASHTRLLLKGARRVFLVELGTAIETVRNEEIATAGAIPADTVTSQMVGSSKNPKHWLKGFEGLGVKVADLSHYTNILTDKQQIAFSLKREYGLRLSEVASRMGLDRKTAYEHIKAADRKINQAFSSERRKARRARSKPES